MVADPLDGPRKLPLDLLFLRHRTAPDWGRRCAVMSGWH